MFSPLTISWRYHSLVLKYWRCVPCFFTAWCINLEISYVIGFIRLILIHRYKNIGTFGNKLWFNAMYLLVIILIQFHLSFLMFSDTLWYLVLICSGLYLSMLKIYDQQDCINVTSGSHHYWNIWLTHWGRVTHICVGNLTIIGSDNGLSPGRRQAITWTNVGILLIGPLGTNFSEIEIHTFSFKKIHLKMSIGKWRSFCLGLNVLMINSY